MTVTRAIKEYLHSSEFRSQIVERYARFEVLSEAALRTVVANLLAARLQALGVQAEGYRVSCETHLANVNVIPDVLIWKNKHPRIWIELKATRHFDAAKARADWEKLQSHCKQYASVKAGYLIYVARLNKGNLGIKRDNQTRRYWPIAIALSEQMLHRDKWYAEYKRRAHYKPPAKRSEQKGTLK